MSNRKPIIPAVLLLCVFALLLSVEVVVTPVFCYKADGDANLELSVMSLVCSCSGAHDHGTTQETETAIHSYSVCGFTPCLDLPLNSSWLERTTSDPGIRFDRIDTFTGMICIQPERIRPLSGRGPTSRLSKFLIDTSPTDDSVILRC